MVSDEVGGGDGDAEVEADDVGGGVDEEGEL